MRTSSVGAVNSEPDRRHAPSGRVGDLQSPSESLCHPPRIRDRGNRRGVTLIEMLIVITLIALLSALSYSSAAAGVDSLRIRSAADKVVSFLNTALDRAERRQQVIEIRISFRESAISARSADLSFDRTFEVPDPIYITAVEPALADGANPDIQRRFLVYPGGTAPRIAVDLASRDGRRRRVIVDPVTGTPRSESEVQAK
jgi:prepilin-type N-terminal cleavage/methylation domain-containing protein